MRRQRRYRSAVGTNEKLWESGALKKEGRICFHGRQRGNREMEIREIRCEDAEAFLEMKKQLDRETEFMLYEPDERQTTLEEMRSQLKEAEQSERLAIFAVFDDERPVGFVESHAGSLRRNRHRASLVIGLLQAYRGRGYGRALLERLEQWARLKGIRRLELTVMEHNRPAMFLYSRFGFSIEGMRKGSLCVNDELVNEFYMAKRLDGGFEK
ncbi:MAG TPA: GNAT family N-acetyltransferase [Bacillales bacterium]|nr:GNAT family N-acetyltransferase [Bacillales bacterium]